ncbi:flagellar biosynthetic protein FliO [Arthrobacter sulfonylureivorans]|uniref:flagellar biosynthetic protein FliO n=1 Tax=Arthrobacter sulfonylureivorans TaxID=2486855 RepID=UPI0039E6056B
METVVLALRVALSLAVVLGLLWVLQRRFSRGARTGARKLVRVVERQTIGPKASVVVVDADGQRFLLGVTDQAVNVLDTREAPAEEETQPSHRAPQTASDSFARLLEAATGRAAGKGHAAGRTPARAMATDRATTQTSAQYDGGASPRRAAAPAVGAGFTDGAHGSAAGNGRPEGMGDAAGPANPFDAAVAGYSAAPAAGSFDLPRRAARRAAAQPQPVETETYGYHQSMDEQELDGAAFEEPRQDTDVIPLRHAGLYPIDGGRRSERTGRRASRAASWQDQFPDSPLAGSILSPSTWKQTAEALKQVRSR